MNCVTLELDYFHLDRDREKVESLGPLKDPQASNAPVLALFSKWQKTNEAIYGRSFNASLST